MIYNGSEKAPESRNRESGMDELEAVESAIRSTIDAGYLV